MIKTSQTRTQSPSENPEKVERLVPNEGKLLPVCYRCTQVPKRGLYDGFRVQGIFFVRIASKNFSQRNRTLRNTKNSYF
ncbi:MAG: hypothetical protein NHB14_11375 [Desulfosporosinus sp.]|nr:hypothetical protein [Desulfosporosinus sp.]